MASIRQLEQTNFASRKGRRIDGRIADVGANAGRERRAGGVWLGRRNKFEAGTGHVSGIWMLGIFGFSSNFAIDLEILNDHFRIYANSIA